jgi:hypothetical protein
MINCDEERERGKGERGKGTPYLKAGVSNIDTAKLSHYVP